MGEQPGDFDTARGEVFSITVPEDVVSDRVDRYLADAIPRLSRARILDLFEDECITVNGLQWRPSRRVKGGEQIVVSVPPIISKIEPAPMEFRVLYEDAELAVIDKPAGVIVHPGAGTSGPTLVNGLLHRYPELTGVGDPDRPGIVHRLDKDTSGLIVVAKTDEAHRSLSDQFKAHSVDKVYYALVFGNPKQDEGEIEAAVGRHPVDRKRMSVYSRRGKDALSYWKVLERYGPLAFVELRIKTGRTHQIRVHMNSIGHPVLGDNIYGNSVKRVQGIQDTRLRSQIRSMKRQALHAGRISFLHPATGRQVTFEAPLPEDIGSLRRFLNEYVEGKYK